MRKLVVAEFISLDGVVEAPETWHFPYADDQMSAALAANAAQADTMLLGRVTYQTFAGAFANAPADNPVAAMMNRPRKVVVSRTLTELTWQRSDRLDGDPIEQIGKLKEQPGGTILTIGSITLARSMLAAGLVDELDLLVHPIVVGAGTRLFANDGPKIPLTLVACTTFISGVTHQVYRVA